MENKWLDFLQEVKITKAATTHALYSTALSHFKTCTSAEVLVFIEKAKLSDTSKKLYLNILGTALEYYGVTDRNVARIIKNYRANIPIEPCPSDSEMETIWNTLKTSRDRLIFSLMAYNGLRVSEVQALTIDSVIADNAILLEHTKGKQDSIVTLVHPRCIESLVDWLEQRPSVKGERGLFLTRYRKQMTLDGMKYAVKKWCTDLGLPYHPHSFRRYFANTLNKGGIPLQTISAAMRHKNIKTTMGYLNIGQYDVANALESVYKK